MPPVVRGDGVDIASEHDAFPATRTMECSANVTVNGIGVVRYMDKIQPHTHGRAAKGHSSTATVNGRGIVRLGDAVSCGGILITGSSNVLCG